MVKFLPAGRQGYTRTVITPMYFVYILQDSIGRFYKGMTCNLDRRIREHSRGTCQTTKAMNNPKLVFVQICENQSEARSLERYLKSGSGREIIREIIAPLW